jgi:hypothetical protein
VSDLKPTSRRRTVAAAIAAGRVYTYGWATQIWQTLVDDEGREIGHEPVGRQAWELLAHKLAEKPTAELPSDRVLLRLTLGRSGVAGRAHPGQDDPTLGGCPVTITMTPEVAAALRAPFADAEIGKLPRVFCGKCRDARGKVCEQHTAVRCRDCGNRITSAHLHLDYVGHAEVTDRLLQVDPMWSWEPLALSPEGLPLVDPHGGMWIRLTVAGVTRLGYGHADGKKGPDAIKETIGDAIRNAAIRFGVAIDLWGSKFLPPAEHATEPDPVEGPTAEVNLQAIANNVRDWALKSGRTAAELDSAHRRLHAEHPDAVTVEVVNEYGDDEQLRTFLARRGTRGRADADVGTRRADPAGARRRRGHPAAAPPHARPVRELGYHGDENRDQRLTVIRSTIRRDIDSSTELTAAEADQVIARLRDRKAQMQGAST